MSNIIENSTFLLSLTAKICAILINQLCAGGKRKTASSRQSCQAVRDFWQDLLFSLIEHRAVVIDSFTDLSVS